MSHLSRAARMHRVRANIADRVSDFEQSGIRTRIPIAAGTAATTAGGQEGQGINVALPRKPDLSAGQISGEGA